MTRAVHGVILKVNLTQLCRHNSWKINIRVHCKIKVPLV